MGGDEGDVEAAHEEAGDQEQVAAVATGSVEDPEERFVHDRVGSRLPSPVRAAACATSAIRAVMAASPTNAPRHRNQR